ncbi:hypothetical protein N185_15985 [Sinorhizobium sp. GW3]|nr:hypothetical protein N185_15985 [Sinorhizobium sp. GW3]
MDREDTSRTAATKSEHIRGILHEKEEEEEPVGRAVGNVAEMDRNMLRNNMSAFDNAGGPGRGGAGGGVLGSNSRVFTPAGEGAATGAVPGGYRTVSRRVNPDEAAAWMAQRGTWIPSIDATAEFGLVIRKSALAEKGIPRAGLDQVLAGVDLMGEDDDLLSFGPMFGEEALQEIMSRLSSLSLEYVDDYFDLNFLLPEWAVVGVSCNR